MAGPAKIDPLLCSNAPRRHSDCYGKSLVWLVARPLQNFRSPPFTQFQVLHWAVLVGPTHWGSDKMLETFNALQKPWYEHTQHYWIGTILEIHRGDNKTTPRFAPFSTDDFLQEFPRSSIAYVGSTAFTAKQVLLQARVVWEWQSWDYRLLQNNCQTFAARLMYHLTGEQLWPKTISDLLKPFLRSGQGPSKPLRSTKATTTHMSQPRRSLLDWFSSGSSENPRQRNRQQSSPPVNGIYEIGLHHLQTFHDQLNDADRIHLQSQGLGNPQLVEEFRVVEDNKTTRLSTALAVLYDNVFILCRWKALSSVRTFNGSAYGVNQCERGRTDVLFIFAYIYPRHISSITKTEIGWFVVECEGVWLGWDASFTEVLRLEFRTYNSVPSNVADKWVRALELFKNKQLMLEIGTIHDRLPVQTKYLGEVNLVIEETVYRIIVNFPIDSITYTWLLDKASSKVQEHNLYNGNTRPIVLMYKTRNGQLSRVPETFPHGTDDGWREFFAGVFYVLDGVPE